MTLPCKDPSRPLCRDYYRHQCRKGNECLFYHPSKITSNIRKEYRRERGHCYCGAKSMTLMNKSRFMSSLPTDTDSTSYNKPNFFIVCGRTKKSMKRCRSAVPINDNIDNTNNTNNTNK